MSNKNELNLLVTGDGKRLRSTLHDSERDVQLFTNRSARMFGTLHQNISSSLKKAIINPTSGIASAAGIMMLGKQLIDFDANVKRLGINGNLTNKEILSIRDSIIETGIASGQSREDMLAGVNAIVERTGNIKFATDIIKDLGVASTATGAAVEDMGALASNLQEKMDIDASSLMEAMNILTIQGKSGAFTSSNMAAMGERLFSSAGRLGMKGLDDLRKYGALIQVARTGTGSSEQATTSIERILANIIDKQKDIKKIGFDVFRNKDKQEFKKIDEIIKGIIIASKGNEKTLGALFGDEGVRGVSAMARTYRETGGFAFYDNLVNADAGRAGELLNDFNRYSETAAFNLNSLMELGKKFADKALSKSIANLTERMNELMSDPQKMAEFQEKLDRIAEAISSIGEAATSLTPVFEAVGFLAEAGFGSSKFEKEVNAKILYSQLPKAERKRLKPFIDNSNQDSNISAVMQRFHPEMFSVNNNITINQAADGRITSVTSDSLNTKNSVSVNVGTHSARQ